MLPALERRGRRRGRGRACGPLCAFLATRNRGRLLPLRPRGNGSGGLRHGDRGRCRGRESFANFLALRGRGSSSGRDRGAQAGTRREGQQQKRTAKRPMGGVTARRSEVTAKRSTP